MGRSIDSSDGYQGLGEEEVDSYCLIGFGCPLGKMTKFWRRMMVMVARQWVVYTTEL